MQYLKALLLVVFFFVAMLFLCQNQGSLSEVVALKVEVPHVLASSPLELPFYLVVIAAFLIGAICCFLLLFWERVRMSARAVRANWRLRSIQNEHLQMIRQLRQLAQAPQDARPVLVERFRASYDQHKKEREEEKNKKKDDTKQLTIEVTASATPSK